MIHMEPLQLLIFLALMLGISVGIVVIICLIVRSFLDRRERRWP